MGIEKLRWFHWILVGAFVGVAFAFTRSTFLYDYMLDDNTPGETLTQRTFEMLLVERQVAGVPIRLMNDITLYQRRDGRYVVSALVLKNYREMDPNRLLSDPEVRKSGFEQEYVKFIPPDVYKPVPPKYQLLPRSIKTTIDFDLAHMPEHQRTVRAFLSELQVRDPAVTYRYAWWTSPRGIYAIYIPAGIVVIGLIWPMILNLMLYGWIFPPRSDEEGGVSLRGVKGSTGQTAAVAMAAMSAQDADQLSQLERELEKNLVGGIQMSAEQAPAPTPVRKLETTLVEPTKPAPDTYKEEEDRKQFGLGQQDFYPVERGRKKDA